MLYADPTFAFVLRSEVNEKKCGVCVHNAQRNQCAKGYSGFYQCRHQVDGFKLDEKK